ncbi:DNA-binding MarR family transcriptional regulator [Sphingomonas zeicaulis]|uniref:MarR family winged helix-turn-helix transcriptional regulator n=1 Tax=Sphingomonas zeicaulis TaxID=1632740 RepID=UPI003D1E81C5
MSRATYIATMVTRNSPLKTKPAMPDDALDPYLCFAVYSTGLAFNRVYKPLLDRLGLTYPQYLAMVLLWQRDGQAVGELGEKLFLETSTLTPLIKRLESAGYVTRARDRADERVVRVSLTDAGRKLAEEAACVPEEILQATGMTLEQLGTLRDALVAMRGNLRESVGE